MNLIIGDTSQLSYYFPDDYMRISSRNITFEKYKDYNFDRIFLCFAEQRTYIEDNLKLFTDINVDYTIKIIEFFSKISNKIIVYGTSELWNRYTGGIDINLPFDYNYSPYIESKKILSEKIKELDLSNIIMLHPFNFNSIHRKEGFLFSKIIGSIVNETHISIGDTYFYRDLLHPRFIVEKSITAENDEIIGSGRVIFVNDFIRELYSYFDLNYEEFVTEDTQYNLNIRRNINYLNSKERLYLYGTLLKDTITDILKIKNDE